MSGAAGATGGAHAPATRFEAAPESSLSTDAGQCEAYVAQNGGFLGPYITDGVGELEVSQL